MTHINCFLLIAHQRQSNVLSTLTKEEQIELWMENQTNCSGMPVYDNNVCTLEMKGQAYVGAEFSTDTFTCKASQETISPGRFFDIQWCMNGGNFVNIWNVVMSIGCGLCLYICLKLT